MLCVCVCVSLSLSLCLSLSDILQSWTIVEVEKQTTLARRPTDHFLPETRRDALDDHGAARLAKIPTPQLGLRHLSVPVPFR